MPRRAKKAGAAAGKTPQVTGRVHRDAHGRGFGDRLRSCALRWERDTGERMPNKRIAQIVWDGIHKRYSASAVGGWIKNLYVPDTLVIGTIATFFGEDPGWLAFGGDRGRDQDESDTQFLRRLLDLTRRAEDAMKRLEHRRAPVEHVTELPEPDQLAGEHPRVTVPRRRANGGPAA